MTLQWYVVRSNIRAEEKARAGLERLGLVVYLPVELDNRRIGKERREIERPLISRHLFVGCRQGSYPFEAIRKINGVETILSAGGRHGPPQEVSYRDMARIQTAEEELKDEYRRKQERRRKKPSRTPDEVIETLKAASPDQRGEVILSMLGKGKVTMKLQDLQRIA